MSTAEEQERLWRDENNWFWGGYHCPEDLRSFVPKRPFTIAGTEMQLGYTVNFARTEAKVWVFGTLGLVGMMLCRARMQNLPPK